MNELKVTINTKPKEQKEPIQSKKKITKKMIRILTMIAEHGYLSLQEIGEIYGNPHYSRQAAKNLIAHKLIKTIPTYARMPRVFLLTQPGFDFLHSLGLCRVMSYYQEYDFRLTTMGHHLDIARTRLILEKHPKVKDFTPEKVLSFKYKGIQGLRLPDARFLFGTTPVALEVELTPKLPETTKEILLTYDRDPNTSRVLWFVPSTTLMERIQKALLSLGPELRSPSKNWFIMREDLFTKKLNAPWLDINGRPHQITNKERELHGTN